MAEIEIILPTVQFGNVKVRATPEELGLKDIADGYSLGVAAAVYLNVFSQGFKKGASLDVDPHPAASQDAGEAQAQELLNEGLGGVTELPEDPEDVDGDLDAPWSRTPAVDAKPKPWEKSGKPEAAPKVATIDW